MFGVLWLLGILAILWVLAISLFIATLVLVALLTLLMTMIPGIVLLLRLANATSIILIPRLFIWKHLIRLIDVFEFILLAFVDIRMVLFSKLSIRSLYLILRRTGIDPQNTIIVLVFIECCEIEAELSWKHSSICNLYVRVWVKGGWLDSAARIRSKYEFVWKVGEFGVKLIYLRSTFIKIKLAF